MKLLTCLLLLASPVCFAQVFTFNQGGTSSKNYYEEIPYEYINGKIFLEGEIAGKKHRFLFDTGAPVAISKELALQLNAKVLHKDIIDDTFLHTDSVTTVELNDLKLGSLSFNHIPAITLFPDFYNCYHIDGVIGSNLLRNSIISINNTKHVIVFTDQKNKLNLKSKYSTDLVFKEGYQSDPQIKIVMNKKVTLTIPFDTGDNEFLRINDKMVSSLTQYAIFDTLTTGYGASTIGLMGLQTAADKYLFKVASFSVGNGIFNNLIAESNKDAIPAIGSKLLEYGTVTLDFINAKFYFDANTPVNDVGEKQWPLRTTFAGNKLIAGVIWQKADGLVKQGEQITAIDNTDYSNVTICDLVNNKPPLYGKETAVLTLKDDAGNTRKVTINKE
ncbi:hypothetical protein FO440_03000 [Mucilaginibacter corticis]|uniref:Aspartyl protease n=1 Tax=Mucilaginibacter corticis TaxID=2597670 RepID=A0A556MTB4_9SPHI|nr:retropepsin-like aspartic protease [Mucilaginibacter corticis]TSJ43174.1 hypothetical protein FO440_03000 [Mucilaginibacter corticis]